MSFKHSISFKITLLFLFPNLGEELRLVCFPLLLELLQLRLMASIDQTPFVSVLFLNCHELALVLAF